MVKTITAKCSYCLNLCRHTFFGERKNICITCYYSMSAEQRKLYKRENHIFRQTNLRNKIKNKYCRDCFNEIDNYDRSRTRCSKCLDKIKLKMFVKRGGIIPNEKKKCSSGRPKKKRASKTKTIRRCKTKVSKRRLFLQRNKR